MTDHRIFISKIVDPEAIPDLNPKEMAEELVQLYARIAKLEAVAEAAERLFGKAPVVHEATELRQALAALDAGDTP